jgi:hypothetical protein
MVSINKALMFVLLGSALAIFSQISKSDIIGVNSFEHQLKFYLRYAFPSGGLLQKFEYSPSVAIICNENDCSKVSQEIAVSLPPKSPLATLSKFDPSYTVTMVMGAILDELQIKNAAMPESDWVRVEWGDGRCKTVQWRVNNKLMKLMIFANPSEGKNRNVICFVSELLKGSGGTVQWPYDEIVKTVETDKSSQLVFFQSATKVVLNYHWSTLVKPGTTMSETEKTWREYLKKMKN